MTRGPAVVARGARALLYYGIPVVSALAGLVTLALIALAVMHG